MYGPKWPFLLRYGSRNTRRIEFPRVDELSMDTPGLGRHKIRPQRKANIQPKLERKVTYSPKLRTL